MDLVEMLLVDTKGTCLLCQNDCDIRFRPGDPRQMSSSNKFKMLLRHLKVNPKKMLEFSNILTRHDVDLDEDGVNLLISLCSRCTLVTSQFLEKFDELENIKLQLNYSCDELHDLIQGGRKEGIREVDGVDDRNARLAKILREETLKKCSLWLHPPPFNVNLTKKESTMSSPLRRPTGSTDTSVKLASENIKNPPTQELDLDSVFISRPTPTDTSPTTSKQSIPEHENPANLSETEGAGWKWDPLDSNSTEENEDSPSQSNSPKTTRHNLRRPSPRENNCKKRTRSSSSSSSGTEGSPSPNKITRTPASKKTKSNPSQSPDCKCQHCGKVLSRRDHLRRHIRIMHTPKGSIPAKSATNKPGKFVCSHCGKMLGTNHRLHRHVQSVHLKVKFNCEHCSESFSRAERVNRHMMLHHPLEKFAKQFPWKQKPSEKEFHAALEKVMDEWKREKLFGDDDLATRQRCPRCDKTFAKTCVLRYHVLQSHVDRVIWQMGVAREKRSEKGGNESRDEESSESRDNDGDHQGPAFV